MSTVSLSFTEAQQLALRIGKVVFEEAGPVRHPCHSLFIAPVSLNLPSGLGSVRGSSPIMIRVRNYDAVH